MDRERTQNTTGRALIVEDEPHIRELVALHLSLEGLTCTQTGDGDERQDPPPGQTGRGHGCRRVRRSHRWAPRVTVGTNDNYDRRGAAA